MHTSTPNGSNGKNGLLTSPPKRGSDRYGVSGRSVPPEDHPPRRADKAAPQIQKALKSVEVLVVDHERSLRDSCANLLRSEGCQVITSARGDEALELLRRRPFDVLFMDFHMPQMAGVDLMKAAQAANPEMVIIVMTANPSVEASIETLNAGAFEYMPKPFSAIQFQIVLGRAAYAVVAARKIRDARGRLSMGQNSVCLNLLGVSPNFRAVVERARIVARTGASVFLTGESGTGKEVIAQFIHAESQRADRALVPVNCAGLPESLFESEMFGHVKGAFTGAITEKKGLLEAANQGTLFLDELTEMPAMIQAKFLRVLQDGVVRRVGSTTTDAVVDVRVIAGTNQDPIEAVESGKFRRDLFYRLRVVPIHIPPLRERLEDIPLFAESFFSYFWDLYRGTEQKPTFAPETIDAMLAWPWEGNVRELRNVMEHATVMLPAGIEILPRHLPLLGHSDDMLPLPELEAPIVRAPAPTEYHAARDHVLSEFEVRYLRQVVRRAEGNISEAAKIAKVDRTTLYRLMEKHNLDQQHLMM